jgi:hypothetical protein
MQRGTLARSIAKQVLIAPSTSLPKVLGVYGSWGSGKTFLLAQTINLLLEANWNTTLRNELLGSESDESSANNHRTIIATFEAWRYELEGDLAPGLIQSIAQVDQKFQLEFEGNTELQKKRNPHFTREEFKQIAEDLRDVLFELAPSIVPGGKEIVTLLSKLGIKLAERSSEKQTTRIHIETVRQKMQALVNELLQSVEKRGANEEYRLVIVIDDLDRCSPDNMVRLFEWLKNHLNVSNCVYILALDHEAAARAIVGRYEEYLGEERDIAYGYRYLEKLVDLDWELELSPNVVQMAVRQITSGENLRDLGVFIQDLLGKNFPGQGDVQSLIKLRSFGTPRTMLKIVNKFKLTFELLLSENGRTALKALKFGQNDYIFWLLLLTCMYYCLEPYELGEFARSSGLIYKAFQGKIAPTELGSLNGPKLEICEYANLFQVRSNLQLPSEDQIRFLLGVIRENSLR